MKESYDGEVILRWKGEFDSSMFLLGEGILEIETKTSGFKEVTYGFFKEGAVQSSMAYAIETVKNGVVESR